MKKTDTIITLGRQYASGGRAIGKKLASILDIPYYDKEILTLSAKQSGICEELFEQNDEKPNKSFLFSLVTGMRGPGDINSVYMDMPLNHKLFLAQFDTMRRIASQGPCVIVGRCADYVLREHENLLRLFIYSPLEHRIKRVMEAHEELSEKEAKDTIIKHDRQRSSYYNYFAGDDWGKPEQYDLCLNTGKISTDFAAEKIAEIAIQMDKDNKKRIIEK